MARDLKDIQKQFDTFFNQEQENILSHWHTNYPVIQQQADKYMELLQMGPPPQSILDLACGTGVLAAEFASRGYEVTGLDCSEVGLKVARKAAEKLNTQANWVLGDMRSFKLANPVDFVLFWDVIFGSCQKEEEDRRVLRCIANSLKKGGRCLFEVYNKAFAVKAGIENKYRYDETSARFTLLPGFSHLAITSIKLYTHDQWKSMLEEQGLELIRIESGWSWKNDPAPPPPRGEYILAKKI